jgi:hypothetical protein
VKASNVNTIKGLQSILGEAVTVLAGIRERDRDWARLTISAVNSGNGLIRTELGSAAARKKSPSKAKPSQRS